MNVVIDCVILSNCKGGAYSINIKMFFSHFESKIMLFLLLFSDGIPQYATVIPKHLR